MEQMALPALPYAGTSGWSGSETSKKRAEKDDKDGTTSIRQRVTLMAILYSGSHGVTWKELASENNWHHGQASGVLSVLHKEGLVVRLKEKRLGCAVYVAPEYVAGREIAERTVKTCKHCGGKL